MEKVKVKKDFTIKLPERLRKTVVQGDEFLITVIDDSIKLKRLKKPDILDRARSTEDEDALSLEEISMIVHRIRGVVAGKSSN